MKPVVLTLAGAIALVAVIASRPAAQKPFSHGQHDYAGVACETCHQAAESTDLSTSLRPEPKVCLECHGADDLEAWGMEVIPRSASGVPLFSHKGHLARGLECRSCHGAILADAATKEADRTAPGHDLCFGCHDGSEAGRDCEGCHVAPIAPPRNHTSGWLHMHGKVVRGGTQDCESCHENQDRCVTCHQGENLDEPAHPRNWTHLHAEEARKNLTTCTSCHGMEESCSECHAAEGIRPGNHMIPGWTAVEHGAVAKRDVGYCASCHEGDGFLCAGCHRDRDDVRGTESRLNIHGSDWRDQAGHGDWHDDDASNCFLCHSAATRDDGEGFCTYCHERKKD